MMLLIAPRINQKSIRTGYHFDGEAHSRSRAAVASLQQGAGATDTKFGFRPSPE